MSQKKHHCCYFGDMALFIKKQMRFELVYFRFFKKAFKKRFLRTKMLFSRPRYWLFLKPNFLLTAKSKNSRMGAGVGVFIRLTCNIKKNTQLLCTYRYSSKTLIKFKNYITKKINTNLGIYTHWVLDL